MMDDRTERSASTPQTREIPFGDVAQRVKTFLTSDFAITLAPSQETKVVSGSPRKRFIIVEGTNQVNIALIANTKGKYEWTPHTSVYNFLTLSESLRIRWTDPSRGLISEITFEGFPSIDNPKFLCGTNYWRNQPGTREYIERRIQESIAHPASDRGINSTYLPPLFESQFSLLREVLSTGRVVPNTMRTEIEAFDREYCLVQRQDTTVGMHEEAQEMLRIIELVSSRNTIPVSIKE